MAKESIGQQAAKGAIWTYIQQFGSLGVQFLISIVLTRLLSPATFGLIGMITIFIQISNQLVQGGMTQSLIRTKELNDVDRSTVFIFNGAISLLLYGLIYLLAPFVADFYRNPDLTLILQVYAIVIVINAIGIVQITILTRNLNFKKQAIINIISIVISGTLGIALAYAGYGVWSLVYSQIANALIANGLYFITGNWRPNTVFDREKFKYHFDYGYKITLSSLLDISLKNIYYVIIGRFYNADTLGFYTRADTFRSLPTRTITTSLVKVTFPILSKLETNQERKEVLRKFTKAVLLISLPVFALLIVSAQPLFETLFTSKWNSAVPYFQLLCVAGAFVPIHSFNNNILKALGKSGEFLKTATMKKGLLLITLLASLPFGMKGIVTGQAICSILTIPLSAYYSGKFINYSVLEQIKDMLPEILLGCTIGVLTFALDYFILQAFDLPLLIRLMSIYSTGVIVFLFLIQTIRFSSWEALMNIFNRFVKKK